MMSNSSKFLKELKEQTDSRHKEAHELGFFKALENHTLPRECYIGQLRTLAIVFGALERELKKSCPQFKDFVALGYRDKLPLLLNDLHDLETNKRENKPAIRAALGIADQVMLHAYRNPVALLGYLYTLEGSLMGAQMLRSALVKQFDLPEGKGCSYFDCYGKEIGSYWKGFKATLDKVVSSEEFDILIQASNETFEGLISIYEALYPLQESNFGIHSSALNAEAGEHSIPTDPDVLAAAIEASRECWYAFPYFELRYGERGYRFGISDVAWLSTLSGLNQHIVNSQIDWFAKILSNRGMPSLIVVNQLEILYAHLSKISSKHKDDAEKLLDSAKFLQERHSKIIDENRVKELAMQFDMGSEQNFSRKLKNSGSLIVSAVIDKHLGYDTAVSSLLVWLGDETQFSTKWVKQIKKTIQEVEGLIEKKSI